MKCVVVDSRSVEVEIQCSNSAREIRHNSLLNLERNLTVNVSIRINIVKCKIYVAILEFAESLIKIK